MRILIVDDSEDMTAVTEALLVDAGYKEIKCVSSAAEAFEALALDAPSMSGAVTLDLILLDILMPEIDGIEACARIRNNSRYVDTPIIMISQLEDTDSLAGAFIAGATDYITKPVVRVELLARVRASLRLKSELDRRKAREKELQKRLSNSGEGPDWRLIDDVTGLFAGEVAEAYLKSTAQFSDDNTSVIALAVDRIDAYRSAHGVAMADRIMAQVARSVRAAAANVGVVAAAYRNGIIVLIAPETTANKAKELGERLRASVAELAISNDEAIATDSVTASVAVVTGSVQRWADLTHLLTRAIAVVREVAAVGGNRVASIPA